VNVRSSMSARLGVQFRGQSSPGDFKVIRESPFPLTYQRDYLLMLLQPYCFCVFLKLRRRGISYEAVIDERLC